MFLIWGTRRVKRRLGYVSGVCAVCGTLARLRITRIGLAPHFFFVSTGAGRLVGFLAECDQCKGSHEVDATEYVGFSKDRNADAADLVSATNPRLGPGNSDATRAYERIRSLLEPLLRFDLSLRTRYADGSRWDVRSGAAAAAAFLVPISLVVWAVMTENLDGGAGIAVGWSAAISFLVLLVLAIVFLGREPKRYFARNVEALLGNELSGRHARQEELEECFARLRTCGFEIVKVTSPQRLLKSATGS